MNTGTTVCPSCGSAQALYATETITLTIPVRIKWWVVNISQDVKITVTPRAEYCPGCGFIRVAINPAQAKQI